MTIRLTNGAAVRLRVWLSDGVTEANLAGNEVTFNTIDLWPVARNPGEWRLWAGGVDICGRTAQTGLARTVVVQ